ncbi:hypothetical protein RHCRD62_50410 [Rhodococcus sp. RD6.2]|nr:hypothetical protein RHCRD62_50410 [Rhodococcus sp. RD6.2]
MDAVVVCSSTFRRSTSRVTVRSSSVWACADKRFDAPGECATQRTDPDVNIPVANEASA